MAPVAALALAAEGGNSLAEAAAVPVKPARLVCRLRLLRWQKGSS